MAIIGNFSQTPLQGLVLANGNTPKNPTSLQFGPDGRLYISLQNGTVLAAAIEKVDNTYQVVGQVEQITLVKDIPNHNDDGTLNTSEKNRQVTGLVVDQDISGNVVLYVSSSDPRIGAGSSGVDENLDTNSGIISRLVLSDLNAPLGNDRWEKTDLVIGLPRSEENHSTNGLDIRIEDVNGIPHKIMYVAQGGHTNKGAPSGNFAFQPEYYYAGAMLRVDLTELEAIENNLLSTQSALPGGTDYVDSYVYALPTLNDPTRADVNGLDTAVGTTGPEDAEAANTFGGNNGRNQAKFDPDGPVQIYSPGYRNQYDVVITQSNNIYTFDNGPNNGWGDVPLTIDGVPVDLNDADPTNDVATNNPNIDVNTGSDKDPDSLHLVTEGFYAGLPNPIRASGSAAGLFAVDTSSGTPVVTQLTANNATPSLEDDLPEDWADISGGFTNPIEGVYLTPGDNPDGAFVGPDGSYLSIGSSSNGLTEYTADGISDSTDPDTEILIVASFNGDLTFIEVNSDGTQSGTSVTDTKAVNTGGTPLDVTAVGNQGVDGNGKFAGTVWTGLFGPDTIVILEPSAVPPMVDFDQDDDGITDEFDHLQYDPNNGTATVLAGGETLFWDFNPGAEGEHPGKGTTAEGPYNIGLTGWQTNGVDDLFLDENDPNDGQLTDLDNTIRGGAPGIVQVKEVGEGDNDLSFNDQKYAIQTGFLPAANVQDFTVIVPIFNPFSSDANAGIAWTSFASAGISLGDGSQANFVEISIGAKGLNDLSLKVTYEENDAVVQEIELDNVEFLLNATNGGQAIDNDQIEFRLTVDMDTFELIPEWRYQLSGQWSALEQVGSNPIQLNAAGNIVQALQGQYINNNVQSSPVVSLVSSSRGPVEPFTADFLDLTIESTAKPVETADLSLSQTVSDNTPNIGDTVTLTLTVENEGPDQATGVSVQDLLPAGLNYISDDGGGSYDPVTGLWTVGPISSSASEALSIQATVTSVPSATALYRVNVGGEELTPADGSSVVWEADTNSNPSPYRTGNGGAKTFTSPGGIDLSSPTLLFGIQAELFESERSDPAKQPNMLWDFSVVPGSEVEVRLFFAETFGGITAAGERFFDVAVEGAVPAAFDDIDPFATAGFKGAFMLSETVTVADGVLNLEFLHEAQRPTLKAIEILDLSGGQVGAAYENYAQVLTSAQFDPDSTPGDDSSGDDDDTTATLIPTGESKVVSIATVAGGAEPAVNGQFQVSLSAATTTDTVIVYSVSGSASAGSDYIPLSGTVTVPAGELEATIDVAVLDDGAFDPDETVIVTLDSVTTVNSGVQIGTNNVATVTIADDETAISTADLSLSQSVSEAAPDIGDTVTLTLTVNNAGPDEATDVSVQDLLPPGLAYISDDSSGDYNPTTGNWAVGAVASGGSAQLNIQTEVLEVTGGSTLHRVNVGGEEISDGANLSWQADTNSNPSSNRIGAGGAKTFTVGGSIDTSSLTLPSGTPSAIFNSERSDRPKNSNMLWEFDVTPGSEVEVRLYFAETFDGITAAGQRVFDVAVEGSVPTVFDDIDPFASAGLRGGFMLSETVTVNDGVLNLEFLHEVERPALKGIEIVEGGGSRPAGSAYENYAQILSAAQFDPDSVPGDDSIGDDDDTTLTLTPNAGGPGTNTVANPVAIAATANGSEPSNNGLFTVSLNSIAATDTVIAYSVEGTATANSDFTALSGAVTIPAGQLTADIVVPVLDDAEVETDESVVITLTGITNGDADVIVGTSNQATISIEDDDSAPPSSGSAVLTITADNNNVKSSNFGSDSFQLINTGGKDIAQVEIDVTEAIFPDTVFDPFGLAGDSASKELTIDTNGNTGVEATSNTSYIGAGGDAGFEGLLLTFDETVNGGFNPGETLGFSIDMDPNSVRGTDKSQLNAGTSPRWDAGGVSGAELIGSTFTVTFTDGSTATGQLQGANNQAGSKGLADQASPNGSVALTVNGLSAGGVGTYDASGPSVTISGPAGETARVVLAKGFIQPVNPYAPFLQTQLDALAATDFPANHAVELQTVDIVLTGAPQDISTLFDFSGIDNFNFAGESEVPLGFVASVIDPNNDDLPLGPITQPIYLQFASQLMLAGTPAQGGDLLTQTELMPVVDKAIEHWAMQGVGDQALSVLASADIIIENLGTSVLGEADGLTIRLDDDAAGYGWSTSLIEIEPEQIDLLSAVTHEFGHILGLTHDELGETLGVGERHLPVVDFDFDMPGQLGGAVEGFSTELYNASNPMGS
ncbi:MAG: malectin domain-containing carbohydrate-binding protein [Cyanobacteria bacterium J06627_32]